MNKTFFALVAALTVLPGCFGLFDKKEAMLNNLRIIHINI